MMKNKFINAIAVSALAICGILSTSCGDDNHEDYEVTNAKILFARDIDRKEMIEPVDGQYNFEVEEHIFVCTDFNIQRNCQDDNRKVEFALEIPCIEYYSCKDYVSGNSDKPRVEDVSIDDEFGVPQKGQRMNFQFNLGDTEIHSYKYTFDIAGNRPLANASITMRFNPSNTNYKLSVNNSLKSNEVTSNYSFVARGN